MKKRGMVIEIKNRNAIIMTETGQFVSVKFGNSIPICGEDYEGYEVKDRSIFKKVLTSAVAAMFIFILVAVDYYNPVKAVELNMNSKIMLGLNRWNRVMTASAQDKNGEIVLNKVKIKNTTLDEAVKELTTEAKKEKVIKSFSEIKVNIIKGNVDLSLINSNIEKESIIETKKAKSNTNEVENEDKSLKSNDSKNINSDKKDNLPSSNVKKENQPSNNGNNSTKIDDYKSKTNNVNQGNENSSRNEKVKENDNNSNRANVDKNSKKDEKPQGNKKK